MILLNEGYTNIKSCMLFSHIPLDSPYTYPERAKPST